MGAPFDDLEAQAAQRPRPGAAAEVADRTRRERALVGLHERFAAATSGRWSSLAGGRCRPPSRLGGGKSYDWVLLDHRAEHPLAVVPGPGDERRVDRPVLVATAAIRAVTGLGGAAQTGAVAKGFGLGSALPAVSRDRAVVDLVDVDGIALTGTIDTVGQDYLEVAEHSADLPRRTENVIAVRAVTFAGIAMVRRR